MSVFLQKRFCYLDTPVEQLYDLSSGKRVETEVHPVDYGDLHRQLKGKKTELEGIDAGLARVKGEIKQLDQDKKKLEAELGRLTGEDAALQGRIDELSTAISTLDQEIVRKKDGIVIVQTSINSAQAEIDRLEAEIEDFEKQVAVEKANQEKLTKEYARLIEEKLAYEAAAQQMEKAGNALKGMDLSGLFISAALKDQLNKLGDTALKNQKSLEGEEGRITGDLAKAKTNLDKAAAQMESLSKRQEASSAKVPQRKAEKMNLQRKREEAEGSIAELETKKGGARQEKLSVEGTQVSVKQKIRDVFANKEQSEKAERDKQGELNMIKGQLETLRQSLKALVEMSQKALKNPRTKVAKVTPDAIEKNRKTIEGVVLGIATAFAESIKHLPLDASLLTEVESLPRRQLKLDLQDPQQSINTFLNELDLPRHFSAVIAQLESRNDPSQASQLAMIKDLQHAYGNLSAPLQQQFGSLMQSASQPIEPASPAQIENIQRSLGIIENLLQSLERP